MKFRIVEWQFIQDVMREKEAEAQKELWVLRDKDEEVYQKWRCYDETGDCEDDENVLAYDAVYKRYKLAQYIAKKIYLREFE